MTLEDLGYDSYLSAYQSENGLENFSVARVIAEHKERYVVRSADREYEAEILGNLRYTAQSRVDFPAVGDWVAISEYDEDKALIHAIYPRKSVLERQAVGQKGERQLIATNIDFAFIVQAVDRDFSINRVERYLTICYNSKVEPILILNKIDLLEQADLDEMLESLQSRVKHLPILAISNQTQQGIEAVKALLQVGKTYCLLGSSGVGKSTLLNTLSGQDWMKTNTISEHTSRGRHVTTHRELRVLDGGGVIIDNPGMREVGLTDPGAGLETTFEEIAKLADNCRYQDCTHTNEAGCAVLEALEQGDLDPAAYENFSKMLREQEHFESTVAEKRKKDKDLGKLIKNYKKGKYKNR